MHAGRQSSRLPPVLFWMPNCARPCPSPGLPVRLSSTPVYSTLGATRSAGSRLLLLLVFLSSVSAQYLQQNTSSTRKKDDLGRDSRVNPSFPLSFLFSSSPLLSPPHPLGFCFLPLPARHPNSAFRLRYPRHPFRFFLRRPASEFNPVYSTSISSRPLPPCFVIPSHPARCQPNFNVAPCLRQSRMLPFPRSSQVFPPFCGRDQSL